MSLGCSIAGFGGNSGVIAIVAFSEEKKTMCAIASPVSVPRVFVKREEAKKFVVWSVETEATTKPEARFNIEELLTAKT